MTTSAPTASPRKADRRRHAVAGAATVAGHLGVLLILLTAHVDPPPLVEDPPMLVQLVTPPPSPEPEKKDPEPAKAPKPAKVAVTKPTPPKPPPPRHVARPSPPQAKVPPLAAGEGPADDTGSELSEAQLVGAATAGAGGAGRPCDMVHRLQTALRKDSRVQAAVAEARRNAGSTGKAMLVWNGEWVRSGEQEGKGLAAVREAIMWEVGFAPEACRKEPVRGLVLISLNDGSGGARLVMGSGAWRWSDLLHPRRMGG